MTKSRPAQNAFSAGELSPLLYARSDYQRFQTGVRFANGYLPLSGGGMTRAPGTIHRGNTQDNLVARMIPFQFSPNDSLTLEFTDLKMRVWRYGVLVEASPGVPYELVTPYDEASLSRLSWVQSNDAIYIVDGIRPMQRLARAALDNWSIAPAEIINGPFRNQNLDESKTVQPNNISGNITITGVNMNFDASFVGTIMRLEPTDFEDVALWTGNAQIDNGTLIRFDGKIYRKIGNGNSGPNPPTHEFGTQLLGHTQVARWEFVSDNVGIVRILGVQNANTVTATVIKTLPPPCVHSPTYRWSEGAWSEKYGYPKSVEIDDQSLIAGYTEAEPTQVWKSLAGALLDFEPSIEADGSFSYTIAGARTRNLGQWLIAATRGLYIGGIAAILRGFSNDSSLPIGPTTFDTEPEALKGASDALPIAPFGFPIYINLAKNRVFEMRYSFEQDGGRALELSRPARHLGSLGFAQIVWQETPENYAWIRTDTGIAVVMIYDPDEDVLGWTRYPVAGGFIEDISVTGDATSRHQIVTFIVRREINGQTVRFVEEQSIFYDQLLSDALPEMANHLFAAHVFEADPESSTFSVPHLAGETVTAWTDKGNFDGLQVAANGDVELPDPVGRATIGLFDATHQFETLDVTARAPNGDPKGRPRNLDDNAGVQVHRTSAGTVEACEREPGEEPFYHEPEDLVRAQIATDLTSVVTGTIKLETKTGHASEVSLRFKPIGGAPQTILSYVPDVNVVAA